ncbi:hypothetical protein K9K77_01630 [Candidatus Babeliales bacterium]|nr:hypothetical protein [Candidatus Babeliales bacterium]
MKLRIISPQETKDIEIVWLEINTPGGNFVIQNGYMPTTFLLSPRKELLYCFKTGKQESITLEKGGILEITKKEVVALIKK